MIFNYLMFLAYYLKSIKTAVAMLVVSATAKVEYSW